MTAHHQREFYSGIFLPGIFYIQCSVDDLGILSLRRLAAPHCYCMGHVSYVAAAGNTILSEKKLHLSKPLLC